MTSYLHHRKYDAICSWRNTSSSRKIFVSGKDVITQAQSGTGKTATFSVGVLEQINENERECQALILSPTRELAAQVST